MRTTQFRQNFLQAASLCAGLLIAADLAAAADLIVAHIAPYSGESAAVGRAYGEGARLYFNHVNAHGGVASARIAFETRDDGGQAANTAKIAATLGPNGPAIVIGVVGIESVQRLLPALESLQIPLLGPVDAIAATATESRYVFYIERDPITEVDALLAKVRDLGLRKIAVCAPSDTLRAYPPPGALSPRNDTPALVATERCGGTVAAIEAAAQSVAATNAQAVIVAGSTQDAQVFVRALRSRRSHALVVTASSIDAGAVVDALPPQARTWVFGAESMPGAQKNADASLGTALPEFLELRKSAGSKLPVTRSSLAGFISAKVAVEAMRRAGPSPSGADLRNALAGMQRYDAGRLAVDLSRGAFGRDSPLTVVSRQGRSVN
ncbi:MAG TPA: ABC transporter substrate-binding protein [Casimicrobiaceae bacterium]|jgi:ABC-type branched-subunit amino acid transport system substrate-binding protein